MIVSETLSAALRWQAAACRKLGSPFGGVVHELAAEGALGPLDAYFAAWAGADAATHLKQATSLRFMGALHCLVLAGADPALAEQFPAMRPETDPAALAAAIRRSLADHHDHVLGYMASPPQTNEVGRSFSLAPGFMQVAAATGLPLRIFEIGSSAGLNLRWDRYRYEFAGQGWGDPSSPVLIDNDWRGVAPPLQAVEVVERAGCDQSPIDVADEGQALRLQSYVWADQEKRLARVRGAIAVARATPAALVQADAADWTASRLAPKAGTSTVLFHSVMWQYMPQATQAAVRGSIEAAGAAASADAPLAWLRMEPDPDATDLPMELRLTLWPDGEERLLARVHPHGAWVQWL